ncbi:lysophospholipid transporter LplT [Aquabacterium sp. A3]|uniref:lysophospholipid transporter LplT n=1 Tax=Aquabacterium sp. A3 TaxID=3132829 RepID=UPI003119B195
MKKGFYTIMLAQFFSSLADNALFVAAVALLHAQGAHEWQRAALVPMFALFYVVLAPFVGAFADALPKGRVMFISNSIKVVGCLMMLFGHHPLLAYAVVGLGAAAYSPAKYGILTELLPPSQLVKANGWIEGLTITSIILGVVLGGQLMGPVLAPHLQAWLDGVGGLQAPSAAEAAIASITVLYVVAAGFNLRIPRTVSHHHAMNAHPVALVRDFVDCNRRLWRDRLGQISLATTTLFWGVSGNLRYIVLAWAAVALGYDTTKASALVGVVAVGTAVGAVWASMKMQLDRATAVIPLGVGMGVLVLGMNFLRDVELTIPFMILLGGLGGFLVVPMNALLQHRGHNLMGAGRSIAVQNFNEQACILALGALYAGLTTAGLSAYGAITAFGLVVAGTMALIGLWHRHNAKHHAQELERLLEIARNDAHHATLVPPTSDGKHY